MVTIFDRIAWIVSLTLAILLAFLVSDTFSWWYSSGGENFVSWGWIWAIGFLAIIKWRFLSRSWIESSLQSNEVTPFVLPEKEIQSEKNISPNVDTIISYNTISDTLPSIIQTNDETNQTQPEKTIPLKNTVQEEPPKPNWIVTFFSDRPLAKIGGILLFLGALFFLSLVWNGVGPVGKIVIGLIFGFVLYAIGVWMDKRWHLMESRTLLWVGIAINTLTILSGRWIIGDGTEKILSDSITLLFLLLNTLFAVVTGLLYTSRTFLVFSFVFAYLIPFLVRSETNSQNLMIFYTAIVSVAGYFLAYFLDKRNRKDDAVWLSRIILIGSTVLMTLSGLSLDSTANLIVHTITFLMLTSVGIFIFSRVWIDASNLPAVIVSGYIMLTSALFGMGKTDGITLVYIAALVPLMFFTVTHIIVIGATTILSALLFVPLVFGLVTFSVLGVTSLVFILLPILFFYGIAGFFILGVLSVFFQYLFFIAIAGFLSVFSIFLSFQPLDIDMLERIILGASVIVFFLTSLWTSIHHKLTYLPVTALLASSILLALILISNSISSWAVFALFLCIGFTFPLIQKDDWDRTSSAVSTIGYLVILNLFMIGELFYLGRGVWFTGSSTSLITLGLIVFILSIGSLIYSIALIQRLTHTTLSMIKTRSPSEKNMIAGILALPLSLFSLAVAVTFSYSALIVSTVWILESTILAYFSGKTKNQYILVGSITLLAIGITRLIPFFDTVMPYDWLALVPISIIGVSLFLGVKWIPAREVLATGNLYDILHIFGIVMVGFAFMEIIPHTIIWWSLLGMSIFLAVSTWFYVYVESKIISLWAVCISACYFLYHLIRLDSLSFDFWPLLLQLSALSIALVTTFYSVQRNVLGRISVIIWCIFTLLITSLYVNEITHNVFTVTIYLTVVSTLFLLFGIQKDRPYLRTIGLYIGTIVLSKILLYDLWVGVDNLIVRVVALMVSGGVMIALSQLYGRRVNRSWNDEFSLSNFNAFLPSSSQDDTDTADMPFNEYLAEDLRKVDISHLSAIQLMDHTGVVLFESKRMGIVRITQYIVTAFSKTQFAPWELLSVFTKVLPHIRSSLPKKDLDTILLSIENWIKLWWSVNLVSKSNKQ